uniref:Uncharacterized protein n=1 Tax=Corethron hystrix TaxID=216773 RepID=A0A7S1BB40_9STRA|mmetsp:Transcript_18941/g.43158  ORF Transcript_18941/g.43158 Transcript_18941/m.43158 type:complete len:277 (+) Transcript_18941:44-874(+)
MFLPESLQPDGDDPGARDRDKERNDAVHRIEGWVHEHMPPPYRDDPSITINVREQECGDPNCSPVDVVIMLLFPHNGNLIVSLPMVAADVVRADVTAALPPYDDGDARLAAAGRRVWESCMTGGEGYWPPLDYEEEDAPVPDPMATDPDEPDLASLPPLRFAVGTLVECRMAPDPVTGWSPGFIVRQWYRDPNWAYGQYAPYQVALDDGREIFAPADVDQVVRRRKDRVSHGWNQREGRGERERGESERGESERGEIDRGTEDSVKRYRTQPSDDV